MAFRQFSLDTADALAADYHVPHLVDQDAWDYPEDCWENDEDLCFSALCILTRYRPLGSCVRK
jgi:hypothetical protein